LDVDQEVRAAERQRCDQADHCCDRDIYGDHSEVFSVAALVLLLGQDQVRLGETDNCFS